MPSWVLTRLDHETRHRHTAANEDRLALLTSPVDTDRYRNFLIRVFGFESAVETALHMTPGLDELVDLRARTDVKRLKCDLIALDVANIARLPRCRTVMPFTSVADAIGWIYVIDRNILLHGILRRHLEKRLPAELAVAGAYLAGSERAIGARMRELGACLEIVAKSADVADVIVVAAHAAFRCQRHWFAEASPPRVQVA